jgi:hypothetical protein
MPGLPGNNTTGWYISWVRSETNGRGVADRGAFVQDF